MNESHLKSLIQILKAMTKDVMELIWNECNEKGDNTKLKFDFFASSQWRGADPATKLAVAQDLAKGEIKSANQAIKMCKVYPGLFSFSVKYSYFSVM